MISLGLSRVQALLNRIGNPERTLQALHVAGTNGKGSVCTYLERALIEAGLRPGKFTSPHLCVPSDAVQIDGRPVDDAEYRRVYAQLSRESPEATPFEVGTALAFLKMAESHVDFAIVEVGLGGELDATNVLRPANVRAAAITKIAVDHERFLGSDLRSIARAKAGIAKRGVPMVVDASNDPEALEAVFAVARAAGAAPIRLADALPDAAPQNNGSGTGSGAPTPLFVRQNQAVARAVLREIGVDSSTVERGLHRAVWPGRLQRLDGHTVVDGCHNVSAARELSRYVDLTFRPQQRVRWVVAFSKPCGEILEQLLRPGDAVVATEFGPVENMPWVRSEPAAVVAAEARRFCEDVCVRVPPPPLCTAMPPFEGATVVCGSLYLVGEMLALQQQ